MLSLTRVATAVLTVSSLIGCCHTRGYNACDPCGTPSASCGVKKWFHKEVDAWRSRNTCSCNSCASSYATAYPGYDLGAGGFDSGCATCSQGQMSPSMAPIPANSPTPLAPPAPPAETTRYAPHPHQRPAAQMVQQPMHRAPVQPAVQHHYATQPQSQYVPQQQYAQQPMMSPAGQQPLNQVPPSEVSYEVFQRLPGVVVQPEMAQQQMAPVANMNSVPAPQYSQTAMNPAPNPLPVSPATVPVPQVPGTTQTSVQQTSGIVPAALPQQPMLVPANNGSSEGWRPTQPR